MVRRATSGDPAFEGWRRSLKAVADLRDLARSLGLARGFVTYLLVCESRPALDGALDTLSDALSKNGTPEWARFSTRGRAPSEEALVDEILGPLVDERPSTSGKVVAVIDATVGGDDAWEGFFTRLNRARNLVMRSWHAPLIVALPERLLTPFARSAPDVRSGVTRVARVPAPPTPVDPEANRLLDELPTLLEPGEMVSFLPEIQPTRFDGVGGTRTPRRVAGVTLDEALQRAVAAPDPDVALDEVVSEVAREADVEALQDLSRRLRALILGHSERGVSARDTALNRQLVRVLQTRVERHGDRDPETLYALSFADNRLGDRLRRSGVSERAKSHYEESIRLRRELVAKRCDDVELKRALARSLRREGELDQSLSRRDDAIRGFSECVEIERVIIGVAPKASAYRCDLVLDLIRLGSALWAAGRLTESAAAIEESVSQAERLLELERDRAEYRYALALARMSLAGVRDATGRRDDGRVIWARALAALEMLPDEDPRVRRACAMCEARVG